MLDLGYSSSPEYFDKMMEIHGSFHRSPDGAIKGGTAAVGVPETSMQQHELYPHFDKYDSLRKGVLSKTDISTMMQDLGFVTSEEHLDELMDHFAEGDHLNFEDFKLLWDHLHGSSPSEPKQEPPFSRCSTS